MAVHDDPCLLDRPSEEPRANAAATFTVVLINPYELGRQPFALAEPCAWLKQAGFDVECIDLSLQRLDPALFADAGSVAVYVGVHTATWIVV